MTRAARGIALAHRRRVCRRTRIRPRAACSRRSTATAHRARRRADRLRELRLARRSRAPQVDGHSRSRARSRSCATAAPFRGLKVKEAQDRGAVGVLIFSDPADDGYMRGDVYPDGPMRPASAIQRGSVQFLSMQPGDPSTPDGLPSTAGAKRITRDQMNNVPKIPSLPISYREAEKLLRELGGPRVPNDWQGGLPFSYHVGPGGAAVEMDVADGRGPEADLQRHREDPGHERPGGRRRQPSRRLDAGRCRPQLRHRGDARSRARPGRGGEGRLEAEAHHPVLLMGRRGVRPRRIHRVGRRERGDAVGQGRRVPQRRCRGDRARTFGASGGTPSMRDVVREVAAAVPEPKKGGTVGDAWERAAEGHVGAVRADRARRAGRGVRTAARAARLRLRLHRVPRSSRHPVGRHAASAGRTACTTRSTTTSTGCRTSAIRSSSTTRRRRACSGLLAMRMATADVVPLRFSDYAPGDAATISTRSAPTWSAPRAHRDGRLPSCPTSRRWSRPSSDLDAAGRAADAAVDRAPRRRRCGGVRAHERRRSTRWSARSSTRTACRAARGSSTCSIGPGLTTGYAPWPYPALREAVEKKDTAMFDRESRRIQAVLAAGAAKLREVAAR